MFSPEFEQLATLAMCVLGVALTICLGVYQARSSFLRGMRRGFVLGQSHELDAVLGLYETRFRDSCSFALSSYVDLLRELKHRS
jgi:hypothetical protein